MLICLELGRRFALHQVRRNGNAARTGMRNWMYIVGVSATISAAVYVILEREYPRLGRVQVGAIDLEHLRTTM